MAINQEIQIDDLYRNINGISIQMTIMISVILVTSSQSHSFVVTSQTVQKYSDIETIKSDFSNWMQNRGFSQRTVPNYIAAINQTSQYAKRYGIFLDNFFTAEDVTNLRQIFKKLMNTAAFREENIHQHNRFSAAVSKLIEYRSTSSVSINSTYSRPNTIRIEEDRYKHIDFSPYRKILKSKYPRGFRLNDSLDIKKFRRYWNEFYGEENSLSNEVIWDYISHITIAHGKM